MKDALSSPCSAFAGFACIARGPAVDVALALRDRGDAGEARVLVFDDLTGGQIDFDLRGSTAEIVARLGGHAALCKLAGRTDGDDPDQGAGDAPRGRGRPRLGVVAREVTLLPRHWDWLADQPGGASQALRRLVDQARKLDTGSADARAARERAYRFMSAIAGDLPDFEAASRALFAGDAAAVRGCLAAWPEDVRTHALQLAGMDESRG